MCNPSNEQSAESFFGDIISTYTRAQAIEDGMLIGPIAWPGRIRTAGYRSTKMSQAGYGMSFLWHFKPSA